jgi:DNA-binding MarR family transcriptional regulator
MSSTFSTARFTEKQGQYLAFIYMYTLVNGRPPAEADLQRFFEVTPPSVHQMIVQLERLGFLRRTPRQARSIEVLVPTDQLPSLQPIKTSGGRY